MFLKLEFFFKYGIFYPEDRCFLSIGLKIFIPGIRYFHPGATWIFENFGILITVGA